MLSDETKNIILKNNKKGKSIIDSFIILSKKCNIPFTNTNLRIFSIGFQYGEFLTVKSDQSIVSKYVPDNVVDYIIDQLSSVDSNISAREFIKKSHMHMTDYYSFISLINDERLIFKHSGNLLQEINEIKYTAAEILYFFTDILNSIPENANYYSLSDKSFIKNLNIKKKSYSYEIWENGEWIEVGGSIIKNQILPPYNDWILCKNILKDIRTVEREFPNIISYIRD